MNTNSQEHMGTGEGSWLASAEERLKELGIKLPAPPGSARRSQRLFRVRQTS